VHVGCDAVQRQVSYHQTIGTGHDGGVNGNEGLVRKLVGNVEQDGRASLGNDHPGKIFSVIGKRIMITPKMRGAG